MDFEKLRGETLRRIIAVIAIAVTVYYLYWRITETFNPNALLFSWMLWIAEVFGFFSTILFYFTVWRPKHRTAPPPLDGRTVDVFIPTKSESIAILRKTLLACNDLRYPHRTVVLDDGNRHDVKNLCAELGCVYLARDDHENAKAGNLNYGLAHSEAEFIAVFDADHVPLPHFIDRLIGYFEDESIGFVQAPQEFYNIDSFQHRANHIKKYIWGEQYLFFSLIQPGRDHWDAAYFVGSCALLRRKALDDVGGFSTGSITEDMLTSINIHAEGWKSVYHNENLAYGIAAETIHPFHIQRRRWGLGGWQVFFTANPLFKPGLDLGQRLCYLASLIYPIEGFQKLIFYVTPPIVLFTQVLPMRALNITYLLHFIPYFFISTYAFNEMGRGFGGFLMLEQFSMGKFATYISTLFAWLLPKRSKKFAVTPKGERTDAGRRLITPQIVVILASIAAIVFALVQLVLQMRGDEFIVAVNCLWALYNSGLAVAIVLYARRKFHQRRESFRVPDAVPVFYAWNNGRKREKRLAVANDVTRHGLSVLSIERLPTDREIEMEIVLPERRLIAKGVFMQGRSMPVNGHAVARTGLLFTEMETKERDILVRYLHESAISKFLSEYQTRYETYLERQIEKRRRRVKRARRIVSYIPVVVNGGAPSSYGAIKNVSGSGLLISLRRKLSLGDPLQVKAIIEQKLVPLEGTVARVVRFDESDFPEYFVGVKLDEPDSYRVSYVQWIADHMEGLLFEKSASRKIKRPAPADTEDELTEERDEN
jgi:cellulose synthase (UDP-forming)